MAVLGFLIKSLIHLKYKFRLKVIEPDIVQRNQLRYLLKEAKYTAFGKHYDFAELLSSDDIVASYQKKVPIFEYDEMNEKWWQEQQKTADITWKGKPDYFALSSGTTSDSKRIPVTNDMLKCIQSVAQKQLESLANFDLAASLFEKQVLMLGSSTALERKNEHLEGEITGISAANLPSWFKRNYKPGEAIAQVGDWDTKAQMIAEQAGEWDIAAISGIPFWMIRMLKKVIAYHGLNTIHDIWPNLTIYTTGGVAFEPYREELNRLTARPLKIMDTYLASEGFLGYTARPDTLAMKLAMDNKMFFEYVPFDKRGFDEAGNILKDPIVLTFSQLEENMDYALLISTPAGTWRYMIGDTIKFTSLKNREFVLSGRTKYFLNVIGAQLTEEKMNDAILQLSNEMNIDVYEYAVAALPDEKGEYYHHWMLGTSEKIDNALAGKRLDQIFQSTNKNYSSSRSKVLKYVTLQTIPVELFYDWLKGTKSKSKTRGGQLKVPKVLSAERMIDLLEFVKNVESTN